MFHSELSNSKYFKIISVILIVNIITAFTFSTELITSFSQNLVKTTAAVYLCLAVFYSFILLHRFANKTKLILTAKEFLLTFTFLFIIYNCALAIDKLLVVLNRDLEAIPSNIFCYSVIVLFLIFQKILLGQRSK